MNRIYKKNNVIKTYGLILIEILSGVFALTLALFIRYRSLYCDGYYELYISFGGLYILFLLLYNIFTDWNRDFFIRGFFKETIAITKCLTITIALPALVMYTVFKDRPISRTVLFFFILLNILITFSAHLIFKEYMLKCYRNGADSDKLMVVTTKDRAAEIIRKLINSNEWNYEVKSLVITDAEMVGHEIEGIKVVGDSDNMLEMATKEVVDRVFISLPREVPINTIRNMIFDFESMGVLCHYDIGLEELNLEGKEADDIAGYPVLSFSLKNLDYRRLMIKRLFDIIGSFFGIIILLIFYPFVALAIKIESKGPVIFKQERVGRSGRKFMMYKFRSMYVDAEEKKKDLYDKNEMEGLMFKMKDDPRITKVGRFLRKTSIDELPQFFNILKGDMSMVGTRPPTVDEYEKYNAHYRRRLSITPGLTGMWQVSGRSDITDFDEVVKLDLEYIDQWSLLLDCKILLQTVGVVLLGKGSK